MFIIYLLKTWSSQFIYTMHKRSFFSAIGDESPWLEQIELYTQPKNVSKIPYSTMHLNYLSADCRFTKRRFEQCTDSVEKCSWDECKN